MPASCCLTTPVNCHRAYFAVFHLFLPHLNPTSTLSHLNPPPAPPISSPAIFPCIIHEWHACFTHRISTDVLCRPEGVSTEPASNLLTHGAASLTALVANYTQFLGMALFFILFTQGLVAIIGSRKSYRARQVQQMYRHHVYIYVRR